MCMISFHLMCKRFEIHHVISHLKFYHKLSSGWCHPSKVHGVQITPLTVIKKHKLNFEPCILEPQNHSVKLAEVWQYQELCLLFFVAKIKAFLINSSEILSSFDGKQKARNKKNRRPLDKVVYALSKKNCEQSTSFTTSAYFLITV